MAETIFTGDLLRNIGVPSDSVAKVLAAARVAKAFPLAQILDHLGESKVFRAEIGDWTVRSNVSEDGEVVLTVSTPYHISVADEIQIDRKLADAGFQVLIDPTSFRDPAEHITLWSFVLAPLGGAA